MLESIEPSRLGVLGDRFFEGILAHAWDKAGLNPRKSFYSGPYGLKNGTLKTPLLLLS
jgi:hypothetical protein